MIQHINPHCTLLDRRRSKTSLESDIQNYKMLRASSSTSIGRRGSVLTDQANHSSWHGSVSPETWDAGFGRIPSISGSQPGDVETNG